MCLIESLEAFLSQLLVSPNAGVQQTTSLHPTLPQSGPCAARAFLIGWSVEVLRYF